MTDYRVIRTRKRNHSLSVRLPERSDTGMSITLDPDFRIARNGDVRITRELALRSSRNTLTVYPRLFKIRKRNFLVRGKVNHG